MKSVKRIFILTFSILGLLMLVACGNKDNTTTANNATTTSGENVTTTVTNNGGTTTASNNTTTDNTTTTVVQDLDETKFTIEYVSGTENAYTITGNTITFSNITENSEYSISGEIDGNIVIDATEDYKLDLEFKGVTINSYTAPPIYIESADKVGLSFKKDTVNYINDYRAEVDEDGISGSIYAKCDLSIKGKGTLYLTSTNNNGIHTKDDLEIKNLTLTVECMDNALKGNDSVTIESGTLTLISKKGDGIKTSNSDVSSKGNQRGTVTISGGTINIYAACDGIDAAYDCVIDESSATVTLNILTDKYSSYSLEVTDVADSIYYIRNTTNTYYYSIKYFNSDEDYVWKNATYYTSREAMSGRTRTTYYYYKIDKPSGYSYFTLYVYDNSNNLGQGETYVKSSGSQSINDSYDTIGIGTRFTWTNYQTTTNPFGGMQEGNPDKGDYSTKGIKADNEIKISAGTITIKSYDDAIHANNDNELENGETPTGNITIGGGNLTLYSNDDGIHADGTLTISGGTTNITNSYEGLEGNTVNVTGGNTSVVSSDDGVNSKTESGQGIVISGGYLYVYAGGDGLDANTKTNYQGIVINGGNTIVISTSSNNSSLDAERGYTYTAGSLVALCPSGGMSNESTNCSNFSSVGSKTTISLTKDSYLTVKVSNETVFVVKAPKSLNALAVYLGSNGASFTSGSSTTVELDSNGVYHN